MNKKGFTLVELLAVIALLLIIISITVPVVTNVINTSGDSAYNSQINKILSAAYDYSLKNSELLPKSNEKKYITLSNLQKEGYISGGISNPKTKENFSSELVISIANVGSNYKYDNDYSILKGFYLYTVESKLMNSSDFIENKPIIILDGNITKSYTSNIDLSAQLDEPEYTAYTNLGEDISDKVIKTIIYNSNVVDTVDTAAAGIYYINYTVVDDRGYSNNLTRRIIIVDYTPPTLEIPENVTISTNISKFNLLEGATCTDNSGKCNIKIDGKINFGLQGKNIIKYIALDPTGNTTVLKRVITVE